MDSNFNFIDHETYGIQSHRLMSGDLIQPPLIGTFNFEISKSQDNVPANNSGMK